MPELPGRAQTSGRALDPIEVGSHHFQTVRRGLDPDAVRKFLLEVADQLREHRQVEAELRAELERAQATHEPEHDDATLASTVGAETSRVLQVAHEAARDIVVASERRAAALVADGETALAERARAAEATAEQLLERARTDASAAVEAARVECRQMVDEAREARRRIVEDLLDRRRALHVQLAQLRAGKDALSELIESVSTSVVGSVAAVRAQLEGAEELASEAASNADIETTSEEELEIDALLAEDGAAGARIDQGLTVLEATLALSPNSPEAEVDEARASEALTAVPVAEEPTTPEADPMEHADAGSEVLGELFARIRAEQPVEEAERRVEEAASEPVVEEPKMVLGAIRDSGLLLETGDVRVLGAVTVLEPSLAKTAVRETREGDDAASERAPAPTHEAQDVAEGQIGPSREDSGHADAAAGAISLETAPTAVLEHDADPVSGVDPDSDPATVVDEAASASTRERRDALVAAALSELGRSLKRQLRVEENGLLDAVRNLGPDADPDTLLPVGGMDTRLAEASFAPLKAAWLAGSNFANAISGAEHPPSTPDGVDAEARQIATRLGQQIVDPIRRRIVAAFDSRENDGDRASTIGAVFRDWRGARVDGVAWDFALDAFAAGTLHASQRAGFSLTWIADDGGTICPDCDDNAIAGAVRAGETFPTGHSRPPVHPGCRCILLPVFS